MKTNRRKFLKVLGGIGLTSAIPSVAVANTEESMLLAPAKKKVAEKTVEVADDMELLNSNRYENVLQQLNRKHGGKDTDVLNLLHFSDIHSDKASLDRIVKFSKKYADYLDDVLHTGDNIKNEYADSFDFWSEAGAEKVLNCVGNHDCATDRKTAQSWWAAGKENVYKKFFEPFIGQWGVQQPKNAAAKGYNYYYKDYQKASVRLIVLDGMYYDDAENEWLQRLLNDARRQKLHVVIASHFPTARSTQVRKCPFDTLRRDVFWEDDWTGYGLLDKRVPEMVETFMDEGGRFVCYLCGHVHDDLFRHQTAYPRQLMVAVPNASMPDFGGSPYSRVHNNRSRDVFNIVSVCTQDYLLRIARVGADYDFNGRHLGGIVYDYAAHDILWQE